MMAGRDALSDEALRVWVYEGEAWLKDNFGTKLTFRTEMNVFRREVTLFVYGKLVLKPYNKHGQLRLDRIGDGDLVFQVTEPVQYFVSRLTATKLILITG